MGITIDQMTTEVTSEPQQPLGTGTPAAPPERQDEVARVRFALALAARMEQRTRAEGFDD